MIFLELVFAVEGVARSILFFLDLPSFDAILYAFQATPELHGYLQDASLWTELSTLHFKGPPPSAMATLFGSLPSAAMRNHVRSTALVSTAGSGSGRSLQWIYDDETSNCMHCNTPSTVITRKVQRKSSLSRKLLEEENRYVLFHID
ncbi:hypothetical protein V7S43_018630 [Phytophthora oleae]|uniref:Uncharacterized protein n=1 Tax=Phytophthora oleae TaxID=2107226 RepID=A0ABD3EPY5_9STRA